MTMRRLTAPLAGLVATMSLIPTRSTGEEERERPSGGSAIGILQPATISFSPEWEKEAEAHRAAHEAAVRRILAKNPELGPDPVDWEEWTLIDPAEAERTGVQVRLREWTLDHDTLDEQAVIHRRVFDLARVKTTNHAQLEVRFDPERHGAAAHADFTEVEVLVEGEPQPFEAKQRANLRRFKVYRRDSHEEGPTFSGGWKLLPRTRGHLKALQSCGQLPSARRPDGKNVKPGLDSPLNGLGLIHSEALMGEGWGCTSTTVHLKTQGLTREVTLLLGEGEQG